MLRGPWCVSIEGLFLCINVSASASKGNVVGAYLRDAPTLTKNSQGV